MQQPLRARQQPSAYHGHVCYHGRCIYNGRVNNHGSAVLSSPSSKTRGKNAEALVARLFESAGWEVQASTVEARTGPDLIVQRGAQRFAVEIKAPAEGRADRVIPLLSQAILQAQTHALDAGDAQPLAVICVEDASQSLLNQVISYTDRYAPKVAIGIVAESGRRYFRGTDLEALNAEPKVPRRHAGSPVGQTINIFSDLNQWMLKVLLAPDLPKDLLNAPRGWYRSGADFANAARVSAMSASRFLQQLRHEGYLDVSSGYLVLVRREDLFRRWRAAVMRPSLELPTRFVIRASAQQQIRELLKSHPEETCLGLFAAADELQLGHVSGVPPYVYVPKLPRPGDKNWKTLIAVPSGIPDLILRQALAPQSTFRGAVHRDGLLLADIIQVWLDVVNHPARGEEQADLIYQKILLPIIGHGHGT